MVKARAGVAFTINTIGLAAGFDFASCATDGCTDVITTASAAAIAEFLIEST
jgi:hypothetical protein